MMNQGCQRNEAERRYDETTDGRAIPAFPDQADRWRVLALLLMASLGEVFLQQAGITGMGAMSR